MTLLGMKDKVVATLDRKQISIVYSADIEEVTAYNSSFDKAILRVAYHGGNRNGSFISKETFEKCIPSIYNVPIVANYNREDDEIGSHDQEVVQGADGGLRLVNLTQPVGVVPESAHWFWKELDDNGVKHEYLCVECLLWKRQEAYQKIVSDGIVAESMEITIKEGGMKDSFYHIDDFEFTAFCLLGTAEPCFENAALLSFSLGEFRKELDEMVSELKKVMHNANQPDGGCDTESFAEGGEVKLEDNMEVVVTEEVVEEPAEEVVQEEFQAEEVQAEEAVDTHAEEPAEESAEEPADEFALAEQFREELLEALSAVKVVDEYGEWRRYCYVDYDNEAMEVYAYDIEDWHLYGFSYSMNGDQVVIDFESKKRKQMAIVDFNDGNPDQGAAFSAMADDVRSAFANLSTRAEEATTALENYQNQVREEENERECKSVLAKFSAILTGVAEYDALCNDHNGIAAKDLEEKCYAIKGRQDVKTFSLESDKHPEGRMPAGLGVSEPEEYDEPYGGLFRQFGNQ